MGRKNAQRGGEIYEPEAVEFAKQEFNRRGIDPALLVRADAAAVALRHTYWAQAERAAVAPTDWADKAIAFVAGFLFPLMCFVVVMWFLRLQGRGEHRKAVQWIAYAPIGAATLIIVLVVAALVNR